ncbi:MAG: WYL domain-containing protein, partial [Bacteroidia bacterium]|nr:WYL domain-containing protein [Bacteroidia bacterium]
MSSQGTIRRYTLTLEKIKSIKCPSFGELRDYLFEHGFEISNRTLQRDIEQIRIEFGIEIKYDRSKNGYFVDEESSINLDSFLRFLEIVATADILTQSLKDGKDALRYISFESEGSLKGIENLKSILFAIRNRRKIAFTHYNYWTEKRKQFVINPYLLKEYQNRWYVIGKINTEQYRTFGIDRIENLEIKAEIFKPSKNDNPSLFFENIIGVIYSEGTEEEVVLTFNPTQGKYIKSLPLHKSQQILKDDESSLMIRLKVI